MKKKKKLQSFSNITICKNINNNNKRATVGFEATRQSDASGNENANKNITMYTRQQVILS